MIGYNRTDSHLKVLYSWQHFTYILLGPHRGWVELSTCILHTRSCGMSQCVTAVDLTGWGGTVLKYSECFNYRFSGLILPCLAVVGCWWCTSQWRFWYITIAESAFHEYHPPVQLLASLENFFWKGHGFEGFIMIILQGIGCFHCTCDRMAPA